MIKKINLIFLTGLLIILSPITIIAKELDINTTDVSQLVTSKHLQRLVYGVKISPYVKKVLITLNEKKVNYTLKEVLPIKLLLATKQAIPENFSKVSPLGKIPAYEEINFDGKKNNSFSISDSYVIMEYLNSTIKNNPLRPCNPKANAKVSFLIKYADDIIAPITHKILFEKVIKSKVLNETTDETIVQELLNNQLPTVLNFLENILLTNKQKWIADTKSFSLADIATVTHLSTLIDSGIDLEKITSNQPNLKKYINTVLSRNSFKNI